MATTLYKWNEYKQSVLLSNDAADKKYGVVNLPSGRVIYRNYGRQLKNGRGLSFIDILFIKKEKANDTIQYILDEQLYGCPIHAQGENRDG